MSVARCQVDWFKHGCAWDAGGGPEVFVVNNSVLHELEWLLGRNAGWTREVGAVKPELQKEWELLTNELSVFPMTVPSDSLGLVRFGCEVIKKNKCLVEDVEVSQKVATDEKESQEIVEKELAQLRGSLAASDAFSAKFMEFEKSLQNVCAEEASVKDHVVRAAVEKADSDKVVAIVGTIILG